MTATTEGSPLAATKASVIDDRTNASSSDDSFAAARSAGSRLGAATALERSRAAVDLDRALKATPTGELARLLDALTADALDLMRATDKEEVKEEGGGGGGDQNSSSSNSSWHRRLGGAALAQAVAAASEAEEGDSSRWVSPSGDKGGGGGSEALANLVAAACAQLRDAEPRVRHAAAGLLGALAAASSSGNRGGKDGSSSASPGAASSSSSCDSFPPVWLLGARDAIFDIVERDWDRDEEGEEEEQEEQEKKEEQKADSGASDRGGSSSSLLGAALSAAYARQEPGKGELRHGSEGWRCLETALVALLSVADGCGADFAPVVRGQGRSGAAEVRNLVLRSLLHPNRFVREAGYGLLGGLCALAGSVGELDKWGAAEAAEEKTEAGNGGRGGKASPAPPPRASSFADAAAAALADGLSENWSQVRLAACVAARSLLAAAAADDEANGRGGGGGEGSEIDSSSSLHSRLLARLLPQLAFNRYDAAEGVRHLSNATWLLHTRGKGRDWVRSRAKEVFDFYLRCSRANNHMVRESAAVCVGELFGKVGGGGGAGEGRAREGGEKAADGGAVEEEKASSSSASQIQSLVPRALQLLLSASRDDAWPVRDEGGRALAGLLAAFPEEVLLPSSSSSSSSSAATKDPSSLLVLDSLISIWRGNLEDNVPSVRDGAAVSMANALEGFSKRRAREEKEVKGEENNVGLVSSAARRLSAAIEDTVRERLPRAAQQPAGECAGAPNAVPLRIQQAPTAAPGKGFSEESFGSTTRASSPPPSSSPSSAAAAAADDDDDGALFAPSDLLSRRRDTGGVDFSCGCMDYGFRRAVEPWEQSDGAARLLREWSRVEGEKAKALALAELLADAGRQRHFAAAPALRETVWNSLPVIASNVGIRSFKSAGMLELFLGPLVECLEAGGGGGGGGGEARRSGGGGTGGGESARSVAAAGAALGALRDAMGPRIFAGRLDERQRRVVEASAEVPPPAGAFAPRGGAAGGGSLLRLGGGAGGVGAFFGGAATTTTRTATTTARTLPPSISLALGAGARPEGYCPGGMPLRK